ncbi:MAG TPA: mechanosensitive ion channel domain-containing protein [Xanthobacteraceae bacterium]|nr:mechanosensitive ion channel domain-containing protein [Xanthobacteraceae bacterium]
MDDMGQMLNTMAEQIRSVGVEFATIWLPLQLAMLLLAAGIAYGGAALLRRHVHAESVSTLARLPSAVRQVIAAVLGCVGFIIFALVTALMYTTLLEFTTPARIHLLKVAASLATAWVVISLFAALLRNHFVNRLVAISAWTIAALSILGLLGNAAQMLDSVALPIGDLRISPLLILKTAVLLLVALWLAIALGNFLQRWLQQESDLTPSIQLLLSKVIRLALITLAIAVVLHAVGINLSALALFSGAVGVGVGFGLQKVVSNLVSGIILLADKSIKPGDVITIGDDIGWVSEINARYTLVTMRDGRETLVPNEDLVTQRVINWSHSNDQVRLEVPFGVSYGSDPHQVHKVALEAIADIPRILPEPAPSCHFMKFGDFSLDFVLRFWISDPTKGISRVRSDVMFALWDTFKREGIEIPYPVRDVRIVDGAQAVLERSDGKTATAA